jgi:glucosyl-3-phosphoglycerate synthase
VSAALPAPRRDLLAVVVVPARDEERLIAACIDALCSQRGIDPARWEILLMLSDCTDGTAEIARAAARRRDAPDLHCINVAGGGAGGARARGMDIACRRLEVAGADDGLIATTDGDSRVDPDWLRAQLEAVACGAEAVGGRIDLDDRESDGLSESTLARRRHEHAARLLVSAQDGPAEHPHFSGASIGITARAYRAAGGMEPQIALEDEGLAQRLRERGIAIHRLASVRVTTSARTDGRAPRGLARDLQVGEWIERRTWDGAGFDADALATGRLPTISVILPAREVAGTIGTTVDRVEPLRKRGLFDELIVVDASSEDGTAEVARAAGATVFDENELRPDLGPCLGKGDAMWRGAGAASGEIVVFLDADTIDFDPGFLTGLLGPILTQPDVGLVKGSFARPFQTGEQLLPGEGGRVTELMARPLLNLHFPELAGLDQPLAGEIAIRRDLFARLSVPVGYGVEIAMLIDVLRATGIGSIAQSRLGVRRNRHQSLRALSAMSYQVLVAAERRIDPDRAVAGPLILPAGVDGEIDRISPACGERLPLAQAEQVVSRPATIASS